MNMQSQMRLTKDSKKEVTNILFWAVIVIAMMIAIFFCCQKEGFHYDEYYTYYSTNITAGSNVFSREWRSSDAIKDEFMMTEGDMLNFGLVKLNQSYDVHPPLYYYLVRIVCFFSKGTFSKWQGLSINLFFYLICLILLYKIAGIYSDGDDIVNMFTLILFASSAGYLSTVTFIRMYVMLTAEVFALLYIHMKAVKEDRWTVQLFIPSVIISFVGFLTHYYFIIFVFFLAFFTFAYLLQKKKIAKAFIYAGSICLGILLAVAYYPSCLAHIFAGYRGKEATGAFVDVSNTFSRINFFIYILDKYTFGGTFYILVLLILLVFIFCLYKKKTTKMVKDEVRKPDHQRVIKAMLVFSTMMYFLIVCKTGMIPSVPQEALRYPSPVYGLIILIVVAALINVLKNVTKNKYIPLAILSVAVVFQIVGLCSDKVFFIYKGANDRLQFAATNGVDDIEKLDDEYINETDHLYVYAVRADSSQDIIEGIVAANDKLSGYNLVDERLYVDIYELK